MDTNPLVELAQHNAEKTATRKANEIQQLGMWKQTGKQEHLQPLLKAYEPVIASKLRLWKAPSIPEAVFHAELKGHLIEAFKSYDPDHPSKAGLNTHVENRLRKAQRFNMLHQNVAHIPEAQVAQIAPISKAQNELTEMFGREPSHAEISTHTGIPLRNVKRVLRSQISDIASSKFESDPNASALNRDEEVMSLLKYSLPPHEQEVFAYLYGDKKHLYPGSMGALATKLGLTGSKISRIHTSIMEKAKQYR